MIFLLLFKSIFHPQQVQMGIVITHVVELNFEKSFITLNVEFLMRWKVTERPSCSCLFHQKGAAQKMLTESL